MTLQTTTSSKPNPRPDRAAFTLLELIIVMAIISAMMTVVIPSASRSRHASTLKQTAFDLSAAVNYAINLAAQNNKPTRILIDTETPAFSLEIAANIDGIDFTPAPRFAAPTVMSPPVRIADFDGLTLANPNWQLIFDPSKPWPTASITLAADNSQATINIRGKYVTISEPTSL